MKERIMYVYTPTVIQTNTWIYRGRFQMRNAQDVKETGFSFQEDLTLEEQ